MPPTSDDGVSPPLVTVRMRGGTLVTGVPEVVDGLGTPVTPTKKKAARKRRNTKTPRETE